MCVAIVPASLRNIFRKTLKKVLHFNLNSVYYEYQNKHLNNLEVSKMTNEARAIEEMQKTYNRIQECKADNNKEGMYAWANEAVGMMKLFEIFTGKSVTVKDGVVIIEED